MKPSLREVLAYSHIAAVAIAVLLLWSLGAKSGLYGPRFPVSSASYSLLWQSLIFRTFPEISLWRTTSF